MVARVWKSGPVLMLAFAGSSAFGCSSDSTPAPAATAGTAGVGGGAMAGSGGSGGSSAGASGSAGAGIAGSNTGGGAGSGGTGGGPIGGAGGALGGSGGSAGSGGAQGPGIELAGDLHELLRTLQCGNDLGDGMSCQLSNDQLISEEIVFGGDPGTLYNVQIRVRGIVEPRRYQGGMLQDEARSRWFYVGGEPDPSGAQNGNAYNIYRIDVSDPEEVYFLNRDSDGLADSAATNHDLYPLDEVGVLTVRGGATIAVVNDDAQGSGMIRNHEDVVVEGVPESVTQPWDGQFFYIEVESITVAN